MSDQLTLPPDPDWPDAPPPKAVAKVETPAIAGVDAKQLRTEAVGALLSGAYAGASTLKLKADEAKKLREDFADAEIEIRPHDGIIYISHMALRERLWNVLGIGNVAEICRERFMRQDSNEIAVDLVLMIRGVFAAEAVGTAKYYPNNPKGSFGDTVESAQSEALRRCCKKFGVGTQVWRPQFIRDWISKNAVQFGSKWQRKGDPQPSAGKGREYTLKAPSTFQEVKATMQAGRDDVAKTTIATPSEDNDDVPF